MKKTDIELMKKTHPVGARVKLIRMNDAQAPPSGTAGTVDYVDDIGTVHVKWDTGSSLGLIYGEDEWTRLITVTCYGQKEDWESRQQARLFYLQGMEASEGSERERYTNIYCQLVNGQYDCSDEIG